MSENPWGERAATRRAIRLLQGGLAGANVALVLAVGVAGFALGHSGLASAGIAAAVVIVFFAAGHAVQVRMAESEPRALFVASVTSYLIRVAALAGLLWWASAASVAWLHTGALAGGAIATVVGWLAGEIYAYSRLRIPVYDTEYSPPRGDSSGT